MRHLIVSEFVTLDGVMEAPGGEPSHPHTNWVGERFDSAIHDDKLQEILDAGLLLVGRVTYESFAEAWPQRTGPMADKLNAMPKHVVSSTLRDPEWANTTVVGPDLPAVVADLKAGDGGPILVHGSATLVQALLAGGLVDELRLMVFPVAIGHGLRVFPEGDGKIELRHTDTQTFPNGVVQLTYARA